MRDLAEEAIAQGRRTGASYIDFRFVSRRGSYLQVKNDNVEAVTQGSSQGFGVRALVDGAWGFSSSSTLTRAEAREVATEATRIARASGRVKSVGVRLAPEAAHQDRYASTWKEDPFEVPVEEQLQLLMDAQKALAVDRLVKIRTAMTSAFREARVFASSEGSYIEQEVLQTGAGMQAVAIEGGEVEQRSYPAASGGDYRLAGWEFVRSMDLVGAAPRVGKEAAALLTAKKCAPNRTTLILDSNQMATQTHESCGHPTELDRVLGMEASYAGTSFMTPERLGKLRYGSRAVNIVADATAPGGLGTFGYDDEGVKAQRVQLVKEGLFVGYQTSRETASDFGWRSSGGMRADGWNHIPLIRMTNINLEPGDRSLDEMIRETKEGVLMATNKSWSIDDLRLNFQFATEIAWEVKDGSLGAILRYPTYTGITYEFWGSCDAVGNANEAHFWGVPNCGKGEPGQSARVGHRTSPARFRDVRVGVA